MIEFFRVIWKTLGAAQFVDSTLKFILHWVFLFFFVEVVTLSSINEWSYNLRNTVRFHHMMEFIPVRIRSVWIRNLHNFHFIKWSEFVWWITDKHVYFSKLLFWKVFIQERQFLEFFEDTVYSAECTGKYYCLMPSKWNPLLVYYWGLWPCQCLSWLVLKCPYHPVVM